MLSPIGTVAASDVILRPWSRDSSALQFISSRSRGMKTQVSVSFSSPDGQGLGLGLETRKKVLTTLDKCIVCIMQNLFANDVIAKSATLSIL